MCLEITIDPRRVEMAFFEAVACTVGFIHGFKKVHVMMNCMIM